MTIKDATADMHQIARDHGWWDKPATFGDRIALMHSELSEALEEYRSQNDTMYFVGAKPEGIQIELADVVIRIMDMFGYEGWDLEQAIRVKADYNRNRPYRHGDKLI